MRRIKNIANRPIPVEDGSPAIPCGRTIDVYLTPRIESLIKNNFFEDLGEATTGLKSEIDEKKDLERTGCNVCSKDISECICEENKDNLPEGPSDDETTEERADTEVEGLQQEAEKPKRKKRGKNKKNTPSEDI